MPSAVLKVCWVARRLENQSSTHRIGNRDGPQESRTAAQTSGTKTVAAEGHLAHSDLRLPSRENLSMSLSHDPTARDLSTALKSELQSVQCPRGSVSLPHSPLPSQGSYEKVPFVVHQHQWACPTTSTKSVRGTPLL